MALEACLCAFMVSWRAVTGRFMRPAGALAFDFWMALVCDSMADGFGGLPVRFHGLTVCDDWEMHVAGWCLGVRGLKEWVLEGMMVQFDPQG